MKHLYLIRHGKATHKPMPDIKRYLTGKGIKRTKKYAGILAEQNIKPDLIISSPATRALQTAEIIAEILNYPVDKIEINPVFYFEPEQEVLEQIKNIPDRYNHVFLIGHNPIWTDLADRFSEKPVWHLRTSGISGTAFETETWKNILQSPRKDYILIN